MGPAKRIVALICWLLAAAGSSYGEDQHGADWRGHHAEHTGAVFDAKGAFVGTIDSFDAGFGVDMTINGALVFVRILRLSNASFTNASASQFQWMAIDCTTSTNCSSSQFVSCGGAMCSARPSMAIRRGSDVTLYIATPAASISGSPFNPEWAVESTYDLTLHHPEPLTVRY